MREIKFRAYHSGRLWRPFPLKWLTDKSGAPRDWDEEISGNWPEDTIFEQYTGLKDKNSKEIYKGDITNHGVFEGNPNEEHYEVVWDTPMARWRFEGMGHIKGRGIYPNSSVTRHCEIIGNIHQEQA